MPRRMSPSTCTEMGHRYVQVHLLRCPHNRGWAIEVSAFEDGADETTLLAVWRSESGPFDDPLAVIDLVRPWLIEAAMAVMLAE